MYIIFHGMMMIVGQRQITVTGLEYIEILKKLIKLTSSIGVIWMQLVGEETLMQGFFYKKYRKQAYMFVKHGDISGRGCWAPPGGGIAF